MKTLSQNYDIEEVLIGIGQELDLPPHYHKIIEGRYIAVQDWICEDPYFAQFDIKVYPQGSYAYGTANRPKNPNEEIDLDFVLEVKVNPVQKVDAEEFYERVWKRLFEHGTYKEMLKRKKRCVCITYKDEFHMDIIPARPAHLSNLDTNIFVPDKKLLNWTASNPNGFKSWFTDRCKVLFQEEGSVPLLKGGKDVDDLPAHERHQEKPPLKQAIRILKRHRDNYFNANPEEKPISIVLTTIAAQCYRGEHRVYDSILNILDRAYNKYGLLYDPPEIENPTNKFENFAEKWKSDASLFRRFQKYLSDSYEEWKQFGESFSDAQIQRYLKESIGTEVTEKALNKLERRQQNIASYGAPTIILSPDHGAQPRPWRNK